MVIDEVPYPLLPAAHAKQFPVKTAIPEPWQLEMREGVVEGAAVNLFGFGQCSIDVEDQRPEPLHRMLSSGHRCRVCCGPDRGDVASIGLRRSPVEDGRAGYDHVRAGGSYQPGDLRIDAAIHFEPDRTVCDHRADVSDLVQLRADEHLSAKARIHAHDQDQIEPVENRNQRCLRRGRADGGAGLLAEIAYPLQRAIEM